MAISDSAGRAKVSSTQHPTSDCACHAAAHHPKLVVITGGPGGGKTAVLELVRHAFCEHVAVLPEAASIVFGGGFFRSAEPTMRRAAQRAIFHVQREMERGAIELQRAAVVLCDRGTIDGAAYWPDSAASFFMEVGSSLQAELHRYGAVIHLRTPGAGRGYDHRNPLRIETAEAAHVLDAKIADAWALHPRRFFVESSSEFFTKVQAAVDRIRDEVPACCRVHRVEGEAPNAD